MTLRPKGIDKQHWFALPRAWRRKYGLHLARTYGHLGYAGVLRVSGLVYDPCTSIVWND